VQAAIFCSKYTRNTHKSPFFLGLRKCFHEEKLDISLIITLHPPQPCVLSSSCSWDVIPKPAFPQLRHIPLSWVIFASIIHMHHRCKKSYLLYLIQFLFFHCSISVTQCEYFPEEVFVIITQGSIHSQKEKFAELLEVASFR